MKKAVLLLATLAFVLGLAPAQTPVNNQPDSAPQTKPGAPAGPPATSTLNFMNVDDVRPGMTGVAYTVFEGVRPEAMGVEVLGILRNMNGPRSDVVLVRLHGEKPEYTGVVAGMSGSPVYIDGKLLGAIAYRIGTFTKEPIAGVTPIQQMLEINEFDRSVPAAPMVNPSATPAQQPKNSSHKSSAGPDSEGFGQNYGQLLQPIEAPIIFSGFNESTIKLFAPQFAAAGVFPVMGAGSVTNEKQAEPIVPGSAVSAVLVKGDMDVAAGCTVTYLDAEHLLACGHPITQYGMVDMTMTKASVVTTLATPLGSFKIMNATEPVGAFVQDRRTGILGRFHREAQMIPVKLKVHSPAGAKEFNYEILNNPRLTPLMMMATVYNSLMGMNQYGEDTTYRMKGIIHVDGYPDVRLANLYSPTETMPTAFAVAVGLGERFGRIYDNPFQAPKVGGVTIDFDLEQERRSAVLELARTDVTEARAGDEITIEAVLRPYRGERKVVRIPVRLPGSVPRGPLRILVSDGDTLDRARRVNPMFTRKLDLNSTIEMLNKEHFNDRVYVSVLEPNPQATVEDKIMPSVPLSIMNVMEGMRATQEMVVFAESAVREASTPVGYAVTGAQIISLTIK
jgi:hypothetical protein